MSSNFVATPSHGGGTLTPSDHKLVTLDFDLQALRRLRQNRRAPLHTPDTRLATRSLVHNSQLCHEYRRTLADRLIELRRAGSADQQWNAVLAIALEAAADTVGYQPLIPHAKIVDPGLARLTFEQRRLRQLINNDHTQDVADLRKRRNRLLHEIRERSKALANEAINAKLEAIENAPGTAQMFEATKTLFRRRTPLTSLCDSTGKHILSKTRAGERIKKHFAEQFIDPTRKPIAPDGIQRALQNPITAAEFERAFNRLRNDRASGSDTIPAELLKHGADVLAPPLAETLNHALSTGEHIHLGDGILLGLPKPNQPAGHCSSLRPIVLLNSIRKAVSLVVLNRISPKVEQYLTPHQSGFRPSRSTADAVWAHRWIAARAQRYKEQFHILGIDLTRVFDTINRDKLLSVLATILDNDELRLIRLLLRGTQLSVRHGHHLLSPFESNTGTPQGDSLSPVLFVVYQEAALRDLADQLDVPHDLLANMIVYADDADFVCANRTTVDLIKSQASAILSKWSLKMNTAKTEHTVVHRSLAAQPNRTDRAKEETWRNTRKLGSLLGDAEDVSRRKTLATAAIHWIWKLWLRPTKTKEATRIRLYNSFVLPILLYNCGTWALTHADLLSLEAFHRQPLRTVIGRKYQYSITTTRLYERTGTEPLRYHIVQARWRLFGHILRRPPTIPAYRYMLNYFSPSTSGGWKGRRRLTLPMVLDADLQTLSSGHRLQQAADLFLLRLCAQDRSGWRHLTGRLLDCTPTD